MMRPSRQLNRHDKDDLKKVLSALGTLGDDHSQDMNSRAQRDDAAKIASIHRFVLRTVGHLNSLRHRELPSSTPCPFCEINFISCRARMYYEAFKCSWIVIDGACFFMRLFSPLFIVVF